MSDRWFWGCACLATFALVTLIHGLYPWHYPSIEAAAYVGTLPALVVGLWLVGRRA